MLYSLLGSGCGGGGPAGRVAVVSLVHVQVRETDKACALCGLTIFCHTVRAHQNDDDSSV